MNQKRKEDNNDQKKGKEKLPQKKKTAKKGSYNPLACDPKKKNPLAKNISQ